MWSSNGWRASVESGLNWYQITWGNLHFLYFRLELDDDVAAAKTDSISDSPSALAKTNRSDTTQGISRSAVDTNTASRSSETFDLVTSQLIQKSSVVTTALESQSQSLINTKAAECLQQVPHDTEEVSCHSFYRSHFSLFKWQAESSWQKKKPTMKWL